MSCAKRVSAIVLALVCVLSLAACGGKTEEAQALDYSNEENWVDIEADGTKPVDVFFIYPTIVNETANEDGFASLDEMQGMAQAVRLYQTTVYDDACNVYMPFYRQAAMALADGCDKDNARYLETLYSGKAYLDIEAALDYYFEHYNNGKPFIIAGHSQGSALVINVLTHYMQEHKDYLSRMVAAYAIGYAPSEDIFNETTGLKFATGEDDYNVVVSFTTEGPEAEGKSILLPENPMVINPLNWVTDDTYASAELNKGQITIAPTYDSIEVQPGTDDAQINMERKTVVCTTRSADDYTEAPDSFATASFHEKEYAMYHENLKENVQTRINAYFGIENESESLYGVLTKVGDKLYEITFDEYADDYATATAYYSEKYKGEAPGCTAIYKDGILMRNLDWYIKSDGVDVCETVIRTTANEGRYATIGVMNNPMVTDETYDQLSAEQLKLLPFALNDGMNSEGLMFGSNVCPELDGISVTTGTNPDGEDLIIYMIGRELLDYCASVDEAIEYLKSRNCYCPSYYGNGYTMEGHFLIADKERAVIIEFVDNELVVLEQEDLPYEQMFCTNHYLYNGGENTGHGMGYERDEIVKANYDSVTDWQSGMDLLEKLKYSNSYTIPLGEDFWYSENYTQCEVDGEAYDFNCDTPNDDPNFLKYINEQIEAYGELADDCWWSNHSSVYDSAALTLRLVIREDYSQIYEFSLEK